MTTAARPFAGAPNDTVVADYSEDPTVADGAVPQPSDRGTLTISGRALMRIIEEATVTALPVDGRPDVSVEGRGERLGAHVTIDLVPTEPIPALVDRYREALAERVRHDTGKLLAHASRQAVERGYRNFPIIDVDSHHYESESIGQILEYMDDPVLQQLARSARQASAKSVGMNERILAPCLSANACRTNSSIVVRCGCLRS